MHKFLEKQKYPVVLLVLGVLLVLSGLFDIKDLTKFHIAVRSEPQYIVANFGGVLALLSIIVYLFDELTFGWIGFKRIHKLESGFATRISNTEIRVLFGRLEEITDPMRESMVVLPANEFFDDECIKDRKSALGAYVNHKFKNQTEQIEALIRAELRTYDSYEVEKELGVKQDSYGVGTGVFLKSPMASEQPVLLLAVTTKRAGEGLRAEMSYIFQAVRKIQNTVADQRIGTVCVPVMGSGHGGLRREVALFGLLLAICDGVTKAHRHHIEQFNVVVYQADASTKPSISKPVVKRLLRIATGMFT